MIGILIFFFKFLVYVKCQKSETEPPKTFQTEFQGKTFIQTHSGGLGIASYHFPTISTSYINYFNVSTRYNWRLDNNQPYPPTIYFKNVTVDNGFFKGIIDWRDLKTTVNGSDVWRFKFKIIKGCYLWGGSFDMKHGVMVSTENFGVTGPNLHYVDQRCFPPENLSIDEDE